MANNGIRWRWQLEWVAGVEPQHRIYFLQSRKSSSSTLSFLIIFFGRQLDSTALASFLG
jgi:hypothetical protein